MLPEAARLYWQNVALKAHVQRQAITETLRARPADCAVGTAA